MASLAWSQRERIRTAASAYRLLVPTRSLPDTIDVPHPFAPALPDHVHALLSLCQAATEASAQAGEAAIAIQAPSRVLLAARAAANVGRDATSSPPRPPTGEQPSRVSLVNLSAQPRTACMGSALPVPASCNAQPTSITPPNS